MIIETFRFAPKQRPADAGLARCHGELTEENLRAGSAWAKCLHG
jgi:hypothetical protein